MDLRERWPQRSLRPAVAYYSWPWVQTVSPGSSDREMQGEILRSWRSPPLAAAWQPCRASRPHRNHPSSPRPRHRDTEQTRHCQAALKLSLTWIEMHCCSSGHRNGSNAGQLMALELTSRERRVRDNNLVNMMWLSVLAVEDVLLCYCQRKCLVNVDLRPVLEQDKARLSSFIKLRVTFQ